MSFTNHSIASPNTAPTPNSKVSYTSATGVAVFADTSPAPTTDNDDRAGWLWTKVVADTTKFNYYYYSEGSTAMRVSDLTSLNAVITIDTHPSGVSVPFFVVYTKPTSVGDAGAWYHSKFCYTINSPHIIDLGESISIWSVNDKNVDTDFRSVEFNTILTEGDANVNEEILTISLHSDSGALINTSILVKELGYSILKNGVEVSKRISLV